MQTETCIFCDLDDVQSLFILLARSTTMKSALLLVHFILLLLSSPLSATSTAPSVIPATIKSTSSVMDDAKNDETSSPMSTYKHVVFSDVDGTLVHYPDNIQKGNAGNEETDTELLYLPPSKSGSRGVISTRTLKLCHQLRYGNTSGEQQRIINGGVPFVLVSGMRTTTLFQRLPYLPRADAYVCESGGRIFYPRPISDVDGVVEGMVKELTVHPVSYPGISPVDAAPFALVEDMQWRNRISQLDAAGNDGYDNEVLVEARRGKLWDVARTLTKHGYVLDTSGYATAFRVNRKYQSTDMAPKFDEFLEKCTNKDSDIILYGLSCATNLGCVDAYPAMSGKRNCAEYLVQKLLGGGEDGSVLSLKTHAYCLCDDDNDIEMALACRAAYLPSVTSESIRNMVNSQVGNLVVTEDTDNGIVESLATEAALEAILKELQ